MARQITTVTLESSYDPEADDWITSATLGERRGWGGGSTRAEAEALALRNLATVLLGGETADS